MTELRKALIIAFMSVFGFCFCLSQQLAPIVRGHWRYLLYAPVVPSSSWTNIQAFGLLLGGLFLLVFWPTLMALRRFGLRQSGEVLDHTQRELRAGIRGMESWRGIVPK